MRYPPTNRDRSERIKRTITPSFAALKENGEMRISPIWNVPKERKKELAVARENWGNLIKSLAEEQKVEYQFKPIDINVPTYKKLDYNDIILEEVLIIKKKQK